MEIKQLVLASSSEYRQFLLRKLHLEFICDSPGLDETPLPDESPRQTARRLSEAKAGELIGKFPNSLIIGSDQVPVLKGCRLSKPGNRKTTIEQLSAASGQCMLQLILIGQPELVDKLNEPQLIQFAQRISIEYHLTPLNFEETELYIDHRLQIAGSQTKVFNQSACAAIFYYSAGVPRLINNICDLAMVFAFANDTKEIGWKTIVEVINERKTGGINRFRGKHCPEPDLMQKVAEAEKLRRAILEKTGVDISKCH